MISGVTPALHGIVDNRILDPEGTSRAGWFWYAAQLRAPLYEDKVVDFLFDKAEITEREVTREELEAAIEAGAEDAELEGDLAVLAGGLLLGGR